MASREAMTQASASDTSNEARPASLTAAIGDVLVRIDGPKLWTLSRIEWRGTLLAVEDSAYGTCFNIQNVGNIGTGHRDIESENVTELRFLVDGRPLESISATMNVHGNRFQMERKSRIRSFALDSELDVRNDVIIQSVRITNDRPVELKVLYPLMYAWTPSASAYIFGCDDGHEVDGQFLEEAQTKAKYTVQRGIKWAAIYDAVTRKGSVSYVLAMPDTGDGRFLLSDAPGVYRKLYLMCFTDAVVPAGFDGTYRIVNGFFSVGKEGDWKVKARERARELQRSAA